jgi:hypothetical protein
VWDSDDEDVVKKTFAPKPNKWAKCVVIGNVFRPFELEEDVNLYNEHKDEFSDIAKELGAQVTKVDIYDREPAGIIVVRTTDFDDAKKLMNHINNLNVLYRPHDHMPKRELWAKILEDRPKFRKNKETIISDDEDDMPYPQAKVTKDEVKAVESEIKDEVKMTEDGDKTMDDGVKVTADEVNVIKNDVKTKDDVKATKGDTDD